MTGWGRGPAEERRKRPLGTYMRRTGKMLLSLASVAVLALTWYGWQFIGDLNSGTATTDVFDEEPDAIPLDGAVDILLVGQDSRTDAQGNPLPRHVLNKLHAGEADGERQTDTMILVHIPQDGSRAVAISFPRDTWVELAGGYGEHKLNGAYVYAYNDMFETLRERGLKDQEELDEAAKVAGRKNLIATIEKLVGKPGMIDRYAEVNLASFYEVTNALGGVEVCLKDAVEEPRSGVDLKAGRQTIKGAQALAFVRQRYGLPRGDLDRIARQQAFLSGLARKMLSTDLLMDPARIRDVVKAIHKSVVLSEGWNLTEFAAQMRGLNGENVEFRTIPVIGNTWIGDAAVIAIDVEEVRAFVDRLTTDSTATSASTSAPVPSPLAGAESVTVDVFNGSGDATLGDEVRQLLETKGFQGDGVITLDIRDETVVRHAPGDEETADLVRQVVGTDVVAEPDSDVAPGTARLLLGSDYEASEVTQPSGAGTTRGEPSTAAVETTANGNADGNGNGKNGEKARKNAPITAGGVPCVN